MYMGETGTICTFCLRWDTCTFQIRPARVLKIVQIAWLCHVEAPNAAIHMGFMRWSAPTQAVYVVLCKPCGYKTKRATGTCFYHILTCIYIKR